MYAIRSYYDGRIDYRDANGGKSLDATEIALDVAAQTADGPFQGNGTATIGGRAVTFDGDVGRIQAGRAVPVRIGAKVGALTAKLDGLLLRDTDAGPVVITSYSIHYTKLYEIDLGADWLFAIGGGAATGLAKAAALEACVEVAAMPTRNNFV